MALKSTVFKAQLQLARETGVRVDDATVNAAVARVAEQNGMSLQQFRERLEKEGISFVRLRADVRDDIVITRLRDRERAEGGQDSIAERDRLDSSRKASPLTCPAGAIDIDSTFLTLDEVVAQMAALIAAGQ